MLSPTELYPTTYTRSVIERSGRTSAGERLNGITGTSIIRDSLAAVHKGLKS